MSVAFLSIFNQRVRRRDGSASPNDFRPRDLSPKAQNPWTVPTIFVQVPRFPGNCVPWDDFGTARILGTAWDSSPRDSPGILEFKKT